MLTAETIIVPATSADFGDVVAVWNAVWPDLPSDLDELIHDEETLEPHLKSRYWLARLGDRAVGLAELGPVPGSYHPEIWSIHVAVIPDSRRQGIGARLFETARREIPGSPQSIATRVPEENDQAVRFAKCRGFMESKRDFESVLDLDHLEPALLRELEGTHLPDGVRIVPLAEADLPAIRHSLHACFEAIRHDIPRAYPPTPMDFYQFESQVLKAPAFLGDGTQLALQGEEVVGFSLLFRGATPGRLDQGLTAVARSHRGQRLATALKARAMRWALRAGFTHVRTDNDTRNGPMLAVNRRFGFRPLPGTITMVWTPPATR